MDPPQREDRANNRQQGYPSTKGEEWSRHSDLNRGPAVYETDGPKRCGTSRDLDQVIGHSRETITRADLLRS